MLLAAGCPKKRLVDADNVVLGGVIGFISHELAAPPAKNPTKWAGGHRQRILTLNVIEYPTLAGYLPKLANEALIVRWSNGSEIPLDSSFDLFAEVIILGLE